MGASDAVPTATVVLPVDPPESLPATLRDLVDTLGPHALGVVAGTDDELDRPVGDPVIQGVGEPMEDVDGRLLLLTGGRPGRSETLETVRAAAAEGAHAVVVKAWGEDLGVLVRAAEASGVVLLCTPDEMAWRHLDALVTAAGTASTRLGDPSPDGRGDLFALANAIAASLGGAVTIEETTGRVMAYSNLAGQEIDEIRRLAILGRQTPDRPTNSEEYHAIIRAAGPVFFASDRPDYASRLTIAVRAGHHVLGVIFVLADRPPIVEDAESVLADAARVTALHLLRAHGDEDPDRTRRVEMLRGLLSGDLDADQAAAGLGLTTDTAAVAAVVRPVDAESSAEVAAARIADLVAVHGKYWHERSVSVAASGQVVLLLPVEPAPAASDDRSATRLRRLGEQIRASVRRSTGLEVEVGFGPVVGGLAEVLVSVGLAEQVLTVLGAAGSNGSRVATLDDVRSQVVLGGWAEHPVSSETRLLLPQVRAVLEHDAIQGTAYAETLLTYLGTFGDVVATAQRLNVHENTARYRVRRLAEMFGIELGAGDETLVTWMQLRTQAAERLSQTTTAPPHVGM